MKKGETRAVIRWGDTPQLKGDLFAICFKVFSRGAIKIEAELSRTNWIKLPYVMHVWWLSIETVLPKKIIIDGAFDARMYFKTKRSAKRKFNKFPEERAKAYKEWRKIQEKYYLDKRKGDVITRPYKKNGKKTM